MVMGRRKAQRNSDEEFSDERSSFNSPESDSSSVEIDTTEPVEDTWTFPVLRADAKRQEFNAALRETQLKIGELQETIRKLHARNAELATHLLKYKSKKKEKKNDRRKKLTSMEQRISHAAKRFGIMNEPFLPASVFMVPRPSVSSINPARYDSDMSREEGIIAELFEEVPKDLHIQMMEFPSFRTTFQAQLRSCRRSMIHQLRSQTAPQIFGQPAQYYQPTYKREDVEYFVKQLKYDDDGGNYTKFAPILFPSGVKDMRKIFRSIQLVKMLKTVLFGASSLVKKPAANTQGRVWEVKHVTPGSIALMAIVAIFLHSPDQEFAALGSNSSIPYGKWFNHYKSFLIKNAQKKHIKELFKWWSSAVFSFNIPAKNDLVDESRSSSGMEEAEVDDSDEEDFTSDRNLAWGNRQAAEDEIALDTFEDLRISTPLQQEAELAPADSQHQAHRPVPDNAAAKSDAHIPSSLVAFNPPEHIGHTHDPDYPTDTTPVVSREENTPLLVPDMALQEPETTVAGRALRNRTAAASKQSTKATKKVKASSKA